MKLSAVYGREIESSDGKICGWVRAVLGKNGAPQFLRCFDGEEREFDVDIKNVTKYGRKIIFEDRAAVKKSCSPIRLGVPAYSEEGKFLGHIEDIEFKDGAAAAYTIGKKRRRPEEVVVGDVAIVRARRTLKADVKDALGEIVLKKGDELTAEALNIAESAGEYFQARLKTI